MISPPTPFADSANSCFTKYQPSPAVDKVGAAETDGVCLTVQQPPDLSGANEAKSPEVLLGNNLSRQGTESVSCNSHQFSTLQRVSRSNSQSGSDCENNKTSFRKEKIKSNPEKWHFSTLPRKTLAGKLNKNNKTSFRKEKIKSNPEKWHF